MLGCDFGCRILFDFGESVKSVNEFVAKEHQHALAAFLATYSGVDWKLFKQSPSAIWFVGVDEIHDPSFGIALIQNKK